jgi:hypothetical protein
MKKTLLFFAAMLIGQFILPSCQTKTEGEQAGNKDGFYGAKITEDGAVAAADLKNLLQGKDSVKVKIKGTIDECCQKKGCWMDIVLAEDEYMKVKFKDYDFFVPKDAAGMTTIIEGWAKMEALTPEEIKHYAEDAGKTPEEAEALANDPNNQEKKITFLADGVIIKEYLLKAEKDKANEKN